MTCSSTSSEILWQLETYPQLQSFMMKHLVVKMIIANPPYIFDIPQGIYWRLSFLVMNHQSNLFMNLPVRFKFQKMDLSSGYYRDQTGALTYHKEKGECKFLE